jgi:hypothetical protein
MPACSMLPWRATAAPRRWTASLGHGRDPGPDPSHSSTSATTGRHWTRTKPWSRSWKAWAACPMKWFYRG